KVSARPPPRGRQEQFRQWYDCDVAEDAVYQGVSDCLVVEPREGGPPLFWAPQGNRPLRVATNRPSFLYPTRRGPLPEGAAVLAEFPRGCYYGRNLGYLQKGAPTNPFAAAATHGKGRLLLLADHSIFINDMMQQEDNQNVEFAATALNWLKAGGDA